MILHQTVTVNLEPGLLAGLGQRLDKIVAIPVIQEDRTFAVSPAQDVIDRSGILHAYLTWHPSILPQKTHGGKCKKRANIWFDPFDPFDDPFDPLTPLISREDLPAELIGLIYRYRWQIELFFKWFKMILGNRHWLAESPRGVAIQLYSALIATLLLTLLTGRRPTKRQMEAIHLYFVGFVTEEELLRELGLQKS
jgi:hypothetical protein